MLGIMMKSPHRLKLAIAFGVLLVIGIGVGLAGGF
jgi:hypothetical protein